MRIQNLHCRSFRNLSGKIYRLDFYAAVKSQHHTGNKLFRGFQSLLDGFVILLRARKPRIKGSPSLTGSAIRPDNTECVATERIQAEAIRLKCMV